MKIDINKAIDLIVSNEVVALPTETVYGLAARIDSDAALGKIFSVKNRPATNPLIIHIFDISQLADIAKNIPKQCYQLAKQFWPGPLTMILDKKPHISPIISAKQNSVAVRIPNHPLFLDVLKAVKVPLAAPSANPYQRISPTHAEHVETLFNGKVPVIDGGHSQVGIESTIVDVRNNQLKVLRPGMISETQLKSAAYKINTSLNNEEATVPGSDKKHYSPTKKAYFYKHSDDKTIEQFANTHQTLLLHLNQPELRFKNQIKMPNCPKQYAKQLYNDLFMADNTKQIDSILIELPPNLPEWLGLIDRIQRAAILI